MIGNKIDDMILRITSLEELFATRPDDALEQRRRISATLSKQIQNTYKAVIRQPDELPSIFENPEGKADFFSTRL